MWQKEPMKIIIFPLLTIIFFVVAIFGIGLPTFQTSLMNQKKKMIRELTHTAWKILDYYEQQEKAGKMTLQTARSSAIQQIKELRYGEDKKDYFWINDMGPSMVIHPYRDDLDGKDLTNYSDPTGKRLFVEFVKVAEKYGAGYVSYMWQWKDNPEKIVPKISYVKVFEPWGWVIGTGVYLEDIQMELAIITQNFIYISIFILLIVTILVLSIVHHGLKELRRRQHTEKQLQEYHDNLEHLVQQRTSELQKALSKVKVLSGFLPICASCKKIRDDKGYWNQIEMYIRDHSEAVFSHSICPDCTGKLYPDMVEKHAKLLNNF